MKRRTFIITTAVAGVAAGVTVFYKWPRPPKWEKQPLMVPYILSGFCDDHALRNIGISYIKQVPDENSKEKLQTLLTSGTQIKGSGLSDDSAVANQLELKIEQNFKEGDIITINGWVLSRSEARQCALFSLS